MKNRKFLYAREEDGGKCKGYYNLIPEFYHNRDVSKSESLLLTLKDHLVTKMKDREIDVKSENKTLLLRRLL